ncbi:hypothetical protein HDU85_001227 [Gaertneriomyces sp. JEL0708]|nr:hypothetical protein HDU85_001227 [Gaertneriomyces sp. JEL0708]
MTVREDKELSPQIYRADSGYSGGSRDSNASRHATKGTSTLLRSVDNLLLELEDCINLYSVDEEAESDVEVSRTSRHPDLMAAARRTSRSLDLPPNFHPFLLTSPLPPPPTTIPEDPGSDDADYLMNLARPNQLLSYPPRMSSTASVSAASSLSDISTQRRPSTLSADYHSVHGTPPRRPSRSPHRLTQSSLSSHSTFSGNGPSSAHSGGSASYAGTFPRITPVSCVTDPPYLSDLSRIPHVYSGYLRKHTPSTPKLFSKKPRFFLLTPEAIYMFKNSKPTNHPEGFLWLRKDSSVCVCEKGMWVLQVYGAVALGDGVVVPVTLVEKTWYLQCTGRDEMMLWLDALRRALELNRCGYSPEQHAAMGLMTSLSLTTSLDLPESPAACDNAIFKTPREAQTPVSPLSPNARSSSKIDSSATKISAQRLFSAI